jgi:chorismate synthase
VALRFLTAGESHGKALVGILEGLPAGLKLGAEDIMAQLRRRKQGHGRGNRQKIETDAVDIVAGVRHGRTLGSPLALVITNLDFKNWQGLMGAEPAAGPVGRRVEVPRPGHADLVGKLKYGFEDMRDVLERSSARETAMRVALASAARVMLKECGVAVNSRIVSIGGAEDEAGMVAAIDAAKEEGDTLGGVFEVVATGLPVGLGSYAQWDRRIEAPLCAAMMSLNAIKGVEVGLGFEAARRPGSQAHDELEPKNGRVSYRSNKSGGIDGGMTTGQPVVVRAAMKPLATLMKPLDSVDLRTMKPAKAHVERSDVCAVHAAAVIGESLVCLVLADAVLAKFGGDSMGELLPRLKAWKP